MDKKKTPDPVSQMTDIMSNWQQMGLGSLNALGATWFEKMSDMGSEWLQFVADRIAQDVQFQHDLLHAKTPTEVQQVQAAFFRKAMDDYTAETGKMISMSTQLFEPGSKSD